MAKVMQHDQNVITKPWWVRFSIVIISLSIGLSWWVATTILNTYVVEPIACREIVSASACINSAGIAGNIAAVLVAVIGAFILVRAVQPRPIIIAVASAALLWDLASILRGVSLFEQLAWALVLYLLSYVLFWLIARIPTLTGSLLAALAAVALIRLLLVL